MTANTTHVRGVWARGGKCSLRYGVRRGANEEPNIMWRCDEGLTGGRGVSGLPRLLSKNHFGKGGVVSGVRRTEIAGSPPL